MFGTLSEDNLLSFHVTKQPQDQGGFGMGFAADLTITSVKPGGAAEAAGVLMGCRVVQVNGQWVEGASEAVAAMKPTPNGQKVHFRTIPPPQDPEQGHFRPPELWAWLDEQLAKLLPDQASLGDVLDAGTGYESFRWLQAARNGQHDTLTAVTMDPTLVAALGDKSSAQPDNRVLVGNLDSPEMLKGMSFDVILADFLLAAIEGFAPYQQEALLQKVMGLLRPDGVLLVVAQQPEDQVSPLRTPQLEATADVVRAVRCAARDQPPSFLP